MSARNTPAPAPATEKKTVPREPTQDKCPIKVMSPKGVYGKPRLPQQSSTRGPRLPFAQTAAIPAQAPAPVAQAPAPAPAPVAAPAFVLWEPIDGMVFECRVVTFEAPVQSVPAAPVVEKAPRFPFRPFKKVAVDRVASLGVRVPAFKKNFRSCLTPGLCDRSCHSGLESL
jgi:hypothetical protein